MRPGGGSERCSTSSLSHTAERRALCKDGQRNALVVVVKHLEAVVATVTEPVEPHHEFGDLLAVHTFDYQRVLETGARLADRFARLCERALPLKLGCHLEPMPWTDVRDFTQAARIVERCGQTNAGVLIDPIHFDRAGNVAAQIGAVAPERIAYLQFCDAPAARPADLAGLPHQARAERLLPGQGGLDLRGILQAVPADAPLSLEMPMRASPLPAVKRACRALAATHSFLATAA